jgi:hypothetical protein
MGSHMKTTMKTTIEIAMPLLEQAKALARRDGVTVRALVEEGLRTTVARRAARGRFKLRNSAFRGRGLRKGIVEGRWEQIRDLVYNGRGA